MKKGRVYLLFAALFLTMTLIIGCSGQNSSSGDNQQTTDATKNDTSTEVNAEAEEPLDLSWMVILYHQQPPKDTVIKEIEALTNTKLDLIWVPDAVKEDRVNTALASGNMPKVMTLQDFRTSSVLNAIRAGMFWELGPYLKDYPNLAEMNETILTNTSVDGKVYGLYRERPLSRQGVVIRKDWLDNLGLDMPTTIDELYEVAKAFTNDDPDQNGQHDTIGFADRNDLIFGAFKTLGSYFGTPNEWGEKDGELLPEFMTDEYVETMKFMKKLYDEKLMNTDFPVASKQQQQELFIQGRAGIYVGNMVDARNLRDAAIAFEPDIDIDITNRIKGPDGEERVWAQGGHNGIFAIPKTSVKTEEELKRILEFFDRSADEDVYSLMTYGLEGIHYNKTSDKHFKRIEDNIEIWQSEVQPLVSLVARQMNYLTSEGDELFMKYEALTEDNNNIIVSNPVEPLFSETFTERGSELRKIIDDATYQFILGNIDEAGFQSEVERWRNNGGQAIIDEFNEAYANLN